MNGPWEEHRLDVTNRLTNLEDNYKELRKGQGEIRKAISDVLPSIAVLRAQMALIGAVAAVVVTVVLWLGTSLLSVEDAVGMCDTSYPDICVQSAPDLDCGDIPHRRFVVKQPDPHGFDGDNDGIGCER